VVIEKRDSAQQAAVDERIDAAVEQGLPTDRELAAEQAHNAAWATADLDERIRLFSETIEADPTHAAAYFDRANTYRDKNQLEKALTDYDRAVAASPAESDYFMARGLARRKAGRSSEAREDFNAAIDLYTAEIENDPRDLNLYLARATARIQVGDLDGTMRDFAHVIDVPESQLLPPWEGESGEEYKQFPQVNALWRRALLRFRMRDYDGTINDCSRMIKIAKQKVDYGDVSAQIAHSLRGVAHGALGHRLRAVRDLKKGAEGGDTLFAGYLLAYPLFGNSLDLKDPLKELGTMFDQMADDL
jgi:tetratricopeptide (TPR) repeat protein